MDNHCGAPQLRQAGSCHTALTSNPTPWHADRYRLSRAAQLLDQGTASTAKHKMETTRCRLLMLAPRPFLMSADTVIAAPHQCRTDASLCSLLQHTDLEHNLCGMHLNGRCFNLPHMCWLTACSRVRLTWQRTVPAAQCISATAAVSSNSKTQPNHHGPAYTTSREHKASKRVYMPSLAILIICWPHLLLNALLMLCWQ